MSALHRKLRRDLWHLKGPAFAIALVLSAGVATFVMFLSTLDSLQESRDSFYRRYRFADLFATVERAPESLLAEAAALPGVDQVESRVVARVTVDIPAFPEPITGLITSIPDHGPPLLNALYLREGHSVAQGRDDEVVISEAFAFAHRLKLGDHLSVVIRGARKELVIVGTAVSPEYVHQLRPGGVFPDYERFAVMWMARTPLAAANEMEGSFNSVVATVARGSDAGEAMDRLDQLLDPYGGSGTIGREHQQSHRFLAQEFRTLQSLAGIFPMIFMGVAAFLLNVVVNRLVGTQRDQIATLKAFGYTNRQVALHYFQWVMVIVLVGVLLGLLLGAALGYWLSSIYSGFFRLPYLTFRLEPAVIFNGAAISSIAALAGTWLAVRRAARLRPAEAMRPEPPALYRQSALERLGLARFISQPTRMILRHLGHRPVKTLMSVTGIAFAVGILMTGRFQGDSVTYQMNLHFGLAERDDMALTFVEPTSRRALHDFLALPGVEYGEVFRTVAARVRRGPRHYRTVINAFEPDKDLYRLFDDFTRRPLPLPPEGIVLSDYLAQELGVREGERVTVEILEGSRPSAEIPVARVVGKLLGTSTYMDLAALNRLMGEGRAISGVYLTVDPLKAPAIYATLKGTPRIAGIAIRSHEIENFHETMDQTMLFFTFVATLFAAMIALGIVYNAARITLTERSRDLASLRVLGFTRGEISYILLGEMALLTLAAIPIGLLVGWGLCWYIATSVSNELYRVALIVEPDTYAFAATVILVAAALSALLVRRRLDELDLIAVLKTRE